MSNQDVGKLVYEVSMDVQELMEARQKIDSQLYGLNKAANSAGQSIDRLERKTDNLGGGFSRLATAVKGYITVQAALKLIDIADDMTMLQARVNRLTSSLDEAKNTLASLSTIAANTGNSLASTEKLWETLTASLKEAGATNGQVLMLTDTLQKIGTVGGSSAEEMSNALRQFGQSIAGGVVRAEEFNSVLENMPELARQMAAGLGVSIGQLRQRMLEGKLTAEDALNAIQNRADAVNTEFEKMPVTVDRAKNSLDVAFKNMINDLNQSIGLTQELAGLMQSVANNLNFYNKNVGDSARMPKLIELQKKYNDELKEGRKWYDFSEKDWAIRRGQAAFELKKVEQEIAHIRAKSAKDSQDNSKPIAVKGTGDSKQDDLIKKSQRRIELSKLEGEARARLQAQYDAEDVGISKSDPRVKKLQDQYAETYRNTQAQKENNSEGKRSASQAAATAEKLANLKQQSELVADSTQGMTREQRLLRAEQSLGAGATAKQKQEAREYEAAIIDANAALKAQSLIPELKENANYKQDISDLKTALDAKKISQKQFNQASEQLEQEHQASLAKIRAGQVVSPQQDAAGMVDPVQQLANENARKLALIQQFEQQGVITHQNALALRAEADKAYEQQRIAAQWEIYRSQSEANELLASSIDSLQGGATNAITGLLSGTQSLSEAFANIGTTILNSVVSSFVQMGIEWVKSQMMGQAAQTAAITSNQAVASAALATSTFEGMAAASTLLASWSPAAMAASIATSGGAATAGMIGFDSAMANATMFSLAGAREHGGPVNANSMYRVGEGGKPEIFKASNGSQYMIPGDNGRVISNRDMGGGGGGVTSLNQVMNLTVNTTNGLDDATIKQLRQAWKTDTMLIIRDQQRPRGLLTKSGR